jgi:hypothetical protein
MRNLLALLAFAVLVFAGAGWYLGWYKIGSTPSADGHRNINVDLNTPKIKDDLNKGKEKLRDILTKNDGSSNYQTVTPGDLPPTTLPTSFQPVDDGGFVYPPTEYAPPPPPPTTSRPNDLPPLPVPPVPTPGRPEN